MARLGVDLVFMIKSASLQNGRQESFRRCVRKKIIYFRSTFIASSCKYMVLVNNECIKGEEVEQVFSGSRIRLY